MPSFEAVLGGIEEMHHQWDGGVEVFCILGDSRFIGPYVGVQLVELGGVAVLYPYLSVFSWKLRSIQIQWYTH